MSSSQTVNPESFVEGALIPEGEIDPSKLSPIDFYWWTLEKTDGQFDNAVCSIESAEEALRFAEGMRHECRERANGNETRYSTPKAVSEKIVEVLDFASGPRFKGDLVGHFTLLRNWSNALSRILPEEAKDPEAPTVRLMEGLNGVIASVEERKGYLEQLTEEVKEESMRKFSLTPKDVAELHMIALGFKSTDRAEKLQMTTSKVSDYRQAIYEKLGGKSQAHAVRIALEEGIITLDGPVKTSGIKLIDRSTRVLELYSLGMNKDEIAKEEDRSPASVNARLSDLVGSFSAASRQNLVYKAIKEGIIPIEKGKYFHLNNAISQLHAVHTSLLSARAEFQIFLHTSISPDKAKEDSTPPETGRVHDGTLRSPLSQAFGRLAGLNDALLTFLGNEYERISSIHPLFDEAEIQELTLESRGEIPSVRDISDTERKALSEFRTGIREKLLSRSMAQAIAAATSIGALSVKWSRRYDEPTLPDSDIMTEIIPLIAEGYTREEITQATGASGRAITIGMQRANETLSATNASSLVYKAIEKGMVIPDNSYKPLHIAARYINKAEINFAQAVDSLGEFDATALNRHLSGLSESQICELEYVAQGRTTRQRAAEEDISLSAINKRRKGLVDSLGAHNIINAIVVCIEKGILVAEPYARGVKLEPEQKDILAMLAQGIRTSEIERQKNTRRNTMALRIVRIRKALAAKTNPEAVFKAYRKGVFAPPE